MPDTSQATISTLEIVNKSESRALRVLELIDGKEHACGVVPPQGRRAEPMVSLNRPVGTEILVRDDHDLELMEKLVVPPLKVIVGTRGGVATGGYERVGDRLWRNTAEMKDFDAQRVYRTGVLLSPRAGGQAFVLPFQADQGFVGPDGVAVIALEIQGGAVRLEIDPPNDRVGDLKAPLQRLPNVDPVLSSYDPRETFADNIKNGLKQLVFKGLTQDSRGYVIADGNYIVQAGIAYNTINTLKGERHSRVVTTSHELTEAFNVGVKISVGKPQQSTESSGVTTSPVPASGNLSVEYQDSRTESRSSTKGYTFAWQQISHYRLTADLDRLDLTGAFVDAVHAARRDLGQGVPRAVAFAKRIADLQASLDRLRAMPRTKGVSRNAEIEKIKKQISQLEGERKKAETEARDSRICRFIDTWGTHFAHEVVFGQACYQTACFSEEELRNLHAQGVNVSLEVQGNINGLDVGVKPTFGYSRSEAFAAMTRNDRFKESRIGGDDMSGAEPITIDLRPLTELITPAHFGTRWREDLMEFRQQLEVVMQTLLAEPDIYPVLQELEIWQIRFRSFSVIPFVKPDRVIYGGIKLNRTAQPLQRPDPAGLDAPNSPGKGRYLWSRSEKPGARAVHNSAEPFSRSGLNEVTSTFYLIAERPENNPCLTLSAYLQDFDRFNAVITNHHRDLDLNTLRMQFGDAPRFDDADLWLHNLLFKVDVAQVAFDQLPDFKRLEIAQAVRARMV